MLFHDVALFVRRRVMLWIEESHLGDDELVARKEIHGSKEVAKLSRTSQWNFIFTYCDKTEELDVSTTAATSECMMFSSRRQDLDDMAVRHII